MKKRQYREEKVKYREEKVKKRQFREIKVNRGNKSEGRVRVKTEIKVPARGKQRGGEIEVKKRQYREIKVKKRQFREIKVKKRQYRGKVRAE